MATVAAPPLPTTERNRVTLLGVAWDTYCALRDAEANDHVRMTYLDGSLTLMSPALRHDQGARFLFLVVAGVAEASEIEFEPTGTTTLRAEGAGKEPDEAFYLGDAAVLVRDRVALDLGVDPPPSLAIEVDHTGDSTPALAVYARLGVPEVWIYRPAVPSVWFGRLSGADYEVIDRSEVLPRLTPKLVLEALAARAGGGMGTLGWTNWLRAWAAALPNF